MSACSHMHTISAPVLNKQHKNGSINVKKKVIHKFQALSTTFRMKRQNKYTSLLLTAALNSRSKWLSTLCLVTVFATPLLCLPSNCLDRRLPSQRSSSGVIPRMKNIQTLQPGAQNPQPGPLPTGPWYQRFKNSEETNFISISYRPRGTLHLPRPMNVSQPL